MNIKKLTEEINELANGISGNKIRRGQTLNGTPWTEEDTDTITVDILGNPLTYTVVKYSSEGQRNRVQAKLPDGATESLVSAIKEIITAAFNEKGYKVVRSDGSTLISVPNIITLQED